MKNSTKLYVAIHNTIAIISIIISAIFLINKATPETMQNAIILALISGISYRMVFDIKVMNFYIGAMFSTSILFMFEWYYIPLIYLLAQCVYKFSCLIVRDKSDTGERPLKREIFIVLNIVLSGVLSAIVKTYFLPYLELNLSKDIIAMFIVCMAESSIGLLFIYIDLKQQDAISSIVLSIAAHLRETYLVYIAYFCMVINIAIMYQEYGYIGFMIASSCILALKFAFEKQAKVTQIEEESYTDMLTGVKNKKFYLESLPEEFNKSCAIFFIDFNGFKTINDKYGHDVGDNVIIHGGNILKKAVREKDEVIRFGGDEFMLLIVDADRDICKNIITRIDTLCEENLYTKDDLSIKISMSIGVAICPEEATLKDELATIADDKMYKAKARKKEYNITYNI